MEVRGFDDRKNVISRLREGFELVRADEYPDWELPTIDDGKYAGVIGVGGLALARFRKKLLLSEMIIFVPLQKDSRKLSTMTSSKRNTQACPSANLIGKVELLSEARNVLNFESDY